MVGGIKGNGGTLAKRGLDQAFVAKFEAALQRAGDLDSEQEALKARLAEKTAAVTAAKDDLASLHAEAKKLVKLDLPKASWKEFGIADVK